METNPYIFNLSNIVEYSKGGEFHSTATLEFRSPTMDEFELASDLAQLVMRATLDARKFADDKQEEVEQDADSDAIKIILFASESVKFSEVANAFKRLAFKICTFDGKTSLVEGVLNKIDMKDFIELVCGYIANFTFPSLFSSEGELEDNQIGDTLSQTS